MSEYYTPEIEEFHVGFECEKWIESHPEGFWSEVSEPLHKDDLADLLLATEGEIQQKYRVKYLDKEDIESLGWEHLGSGWYNLKVVPGSLGYWNYVKLRKWQDNNIFIEGYRGDPIVYENTEHQKLFDGNIKNKSELKRLMKQLGINE
jgi:hypothetical protein